jgi:hypothetical protein
MSEPLDIVMDNSIQIAWDYLKRAGEIDDAAMASRFLSDYIEGLILRGEAAPAVAVEQSHHRLPRF